MQHAEDQAMPHPSTLHNLDIRHAELTASRLARRMAASELRRDRDLVRRGARTQCDLAGTIRLFFELDT